MLAPLPKAIIGPVASVASVTTTPPLELAVPLKVTIPAASTLSLHFEPHHRLLTRSSCKLEGHIVRDCPTKPATDGSCFNCGEQGHSKVDCTNPKKFTGTCRICSKEGHAGRDCPKRGPLMCRNCLGDGMFCPSTLCSKLSLISSLFRPHRGRVHQAENA